MASMTMLHVHGQSSSYVFIEDPRKPAPLDSRATPVYSMRSLYILAAFAGSRAPGWSSVSAPRQQRHGAGLDIGQILQINFSDNLLDTFFATGWLSKKT
jgi:hypothetical protein